MRLSEFILANREAILVEWEEFARTCTPASAPMDIEALRDHADEMLLVIAKDLETPQDSAGQAAKAKGLESPDDNPDPPTAAEEHGADRMASGFSIEQMVSEYRALRASVLRLWTGAEGELEVSDIADLTRFNEAIDQALAESVTRFTEELERSKEMFLAILGHDLRTPLGAIFTSSRFMQDTGDLAEPHSTLVARITSSAVRMEQMVGDLLDFTRSRLGGGIPVARVETSLGRIVHDVVDEISAARPEAVIEVQTRGEDTGEWDPERVGQALTNLIGNAVEHGVDGSVVRVEMTGDDEEVHIAVHNRGAAIPPKLLNGIFNPMKAREGLAAAGGPTGNLGLGLYIAERIAHAHGGRIDVTSSAEEGTTFVVHLPRHG